MQLSFPYVDQVRGEAIEGGFSLVTVDSQGQRCGSTGRPRKLRPRELDTGLTQLRSPDNQRDGDSKLLSGKG
jgi:hypothetical protein